MDDAKLASLYKQFVPGFGDPAARGPVGGTDAPEVPLLTPQLLAEIRAQLASEPDLTLELARRAVDSSLTAADLHQLLDRLDQMFANPDLIIASANARGATPVPTSFFFEGMESAHEFAPRPDDHQYEDSDWWGYGVNVAGAWLKRVAWSGRAPFRWDYNASSRFMYTLKTNAKIGLFSDFGTGLPHSYYIAKFLAAQEPHLAIHLGDVYYAGKAAEAQANFDKPLDALMKQIELFAIPGNHDYYSGGAAYFDGLDRRRNGKAGVKTRQEGSYFTLDSPKFRLVAFDSEYHGGDRLTESKLKSWLQHVIVDAKNQGKSVILLSSDEPYTYCSEHETGLLHDVTANLPPDFVDLWFWGNTHYCAFYAPSSKLRSQFYGCCIGHGGYPYKRMQPKPSATDCASFLWAETEPRFPPWTGVRQDMGNNGFATLELDDDNQRVTLTFRDWTNQERAKVKLAKVGNQLRHTELTDLPRPLLKKA